MNKILLPFFAIGILTTTSVRSQVVINEYSCSNKNTIQDNFTKYNDWIELYNAGSTTVNLAGYYLTDNPNNLDKYLIPALSLNPGAFVVFHCSGRNTSSGGFNHTNFKLTQCKFEKLILSNPSLTILDSLTLNPTQVNHSRGRTTNGAATWSLFTTPTPGVTNTNPFNEYVPRPVMSLGAGFYSGSLTTTISCADPTAQIRFTVNGSTPTATSTLYSGSITIAGTMVIRARAFSANPLTPASFVESNTYFIDITHSMSTISIFGDQILNLVNNTTPGVVPETGLEYFDNNGTFRTETYGTTNRHGNDSWAYQQRGIDFISGDIYGYNNALKWKLFNTKPRTEFQRVILKAAANDNYPFGIGGSNGPAHIRDQYVMTLSQRSNLHLDERTWLPTVIYVNGNYWGLYDLREKVDDADFLDYYYKQDELYDASPNNIQFIKTWGGTWNEYGGGQSQTDWTSCRNYITGNSMAVQANYDSAANMYNTKSLVDYFVLNSFVVSSDWLNYNTAWWRGLKPTGSGKKWRYALWDMDATFGHYINYTGIPTTGPTADPCNPQQLSNPGGQGHVPVLNALLNNPGFKDYYISRFIDLNNTTLNCTYMQFLLDSMITVIAPEMQRQTARWGGSVAGWQTNVTAMKNYIDQRCAAIAAGLINCYTLTGPHNVTYLVSPPGFGDIQVNSITPSAYPFIGNYFGNVTLTLKATPIPNGIFVGWTSNNNAINPDSISNTVTLNLNAGDTVIAHFSLSSVQKIYGENMSMIVYPSAVTNNFTIEYFSTDASSVLIDIHSISGSRNYSLNTAGIKTANNKFSLEVNPTELGMAPGMYFVTCRNKTGTVTQKIVYLSNK